MSKLDLELLRSDKQKKLSQEISQVIGKCVALNSVGNAVKQPLMGMTLIEQRSKNLVGNALKPFLGVEAFYEKPSKHSIGNSFKPSLAAEAFAEKLSKNSIGNRFKPSLAAEAVSEKLSKYSIGNSFKPFLCTEAFAEKLSKNSIGNRFKPSIFPVWQPVKEPHPKELRALQKYLDGLRNLLNDDEFKQSAVWVEFVKKQIDEILELDVRAYYSPDMLDQEKKDIAYKEGQRQVPSSGGKSNAAPWRVLESKVVAIAGEILKKACNHRDRPADMYRISTLAKKVIEWNEKLPTRQKLSLPKESTIKGYIRKSVERGELPVYLKGNKPKKH